MTCWKIAVLVAVLLLSRSAPLHAADGDLDTSFGGTGFVTVPYSHTYDTAGGVAIQTDGKIVTAGATFDNPGSPSIALARLNADGTLDTSFGTGGLVETAIAGSAIGIGIQSTGKLVVLSGGLTLIRFASNGTLDTSFGTGGSLTVNCGTTLTGDLVVQPDDTLVLAGGYGNTTDRTCVMRVSADGALDPTFGNGGTTTVSGIYAFGLARQADGKLLLAGAVPNGKPALARVETDGALDGGFGSKGIVVHDLAPQVGGYFAVTTQPNGRIVAGGFLSNGGDFTVARYLPNGKLDPSFGVDGFAETAFNNSGITYEVDLVAVQDDGKILAVGDGSSFSPPFGSSSEVTIARYDVDGTLDPSFGSGGVQESVIGGFPTGVQLQTDGKAVFSTTTSFLGNVSAIVARIHALTVGCPATPTAGCKGTIAPGGSKLQLKSTTPAAKDQLKWKWAGAATTLGELGDPVATDAYRVCLYDDGNAGAFLRGAVLNAGGSCHGKPCWRAKGTTGFGYGDSTGARFGITKLKLKAGADGKAQLQLQGRGPALPLPPLPAPLPLRVQLLSGNGTCWEATFSSTGLKTNDADRFQGVSD